MSAVEKAIIIGVVVAIGLLAWWTVRQYMQRREAANKARNKARRHEQRQAAAQKKQEEDARRPAKMIASDHTPVRTRRGRASVVLLVEDSPTAMLALRKMLERWNYRVITASNGRQALAELHNVKPDLVISDIDMPEINGIELLRLMRADLVFIDIPVVLITGNPSSHLKASQEAGVNGLLAKPFEDKALIDQVRYILQE